MRDLAPCHPGRPGLVRVALAPCSPPLSPVGRGPTSGDGSGGERTRADESWESGAMFRCFGHGADKTIRTDSPMAWKLSGLSDPLHPLPSSLSLLLSKFLVKETGAGSLRATAHERNASKAQDWLTGRRGEERRLAFEEREEERRKWTQCMHSAHRRDPPPTQPLPNHGLSQFRPSRHHFISTCCCCLWAQRPWQQGLKAGGEGVGLHCCSGLHRQPVSTPSVHLLIYCRIWEHCFLGPLFPSTYMAQSTDRVARSLAADQETQHRRRRYTSELDDWTGSRTAAAALKDIAAAFFFLRRTGYGRALGPVGTQSHPSPDPTRPGGREGEGWEEEEEPVVLVSGKLGGPHPHLVPISQPLSHCTVQPTVPLPFQQGPPSRARSSVLV